MGDDDNAASPRPPPHSPFMAAAQQAGWSTGMPWFRWRRWPARCS